MTAESFCQSIWHLPYNKIIDLISKDEYKQFEIPKKKGVRTISFLSEESQLYLLQKKFSKHFLEKQQLPVCVKGFIKGESYISYLESHVGSKYFMRIDIKDFFPSITEKKIKDIFSNLISLETKDDNKNILDLISEITTYNGVLPQGACSSPMISNIIMMRIDQRILKYCQMLGVSYTRYADDLLFSSKSFDFKNKKWFLKKVKHVLYSQNFTVNYNKIKYGEKEISLNGYVVSDLGIRLSRERLADLKKALSFSRKHYKLAKTSKKLFLQNANSITLKHRNLKIYPFNSVFQFTQFLSGYRSYLISFLKYDIDPQFLKKALRLLRNIESQLNLY